jgi:protoheme ferro-lyase
MAKELETEYSALPNCNTSFRVRSAAQSAAFAAAAQKQLRAGGRDVDVLPFTAWKFNHGPGNPPNLVIESALEEAMKAGVTTLFMWDQDAIISSLVLNEVSFDHAKKFVAANPQWKPKIVGINGLNEQPGFMENLLLPRLSKEVEESFPGVSPGDVCVLAVGQGVPTFSKALDPYADKLTALANVTGEAMKAKGYNWYFSWQNWAGKNEKFPLNKIPWTTPYDSDVLNVTIAKAACPKVLVTGTLQWPVSDVSTLVRETIYMPRWLKELAPAKQLVTHRAWDSFGPLTDFIGELVHGVVTDPSNAKKFDVIKVIGFDDEEQKMVLV